MKKLVVITALLLVFGPTALAQDFNVPFVRSTGKGAEVFDTSTGAGYTGKTYRDAVEGVPGNFEVGNLDLRGGTGNVRNPGFTHTERHPEPEPGFTHTERHPEPESGFTHEPRIDYYRPPLYDPFETPADREVPLPPEIEVESAFAKFTAKPEAGTIHTTFTFQAEPTSLTYPAQQLRVRWDFDGDGQADTYFSSLKRIQHRYEEAGVYSVRLEVLDPAGNVSEAHTQIKVVENDKPMAAFTADKIKGPRKMIVRFDTSASSDNQYSNAELAYRFDWDGNGIFDTEYQKKTIWNHMYREAGTYETIMEVSDPEGATAKAKIIIEVLEDDGPTARFTVEKGAIGQYFFNAESSTDDFTKNLQYRWDFDYQGPQDITFNTTWSQSARYTWNYKTGGEKKVRLQVRDQQGLISESFAILQAKWTDKYFAMVLR